MVYERCVGVLTPHTPHIAFSVSKAFVATVAAMLIHNGMLDEHATIGGQDALAKQGPFSYVRAGGRTLSAPVSLTQRPDCLG